MHILMAAHHFPPRHRGGVEVHTERLARALQAAGETVTVVTTDDDPRLRAGEIRRQSVDGLPVVSIGHLRVVRTPEETLGIQEVADAFRDVVAGLNPDVAHFQHVMYLGLDAPRCVKDLGVPVVLTLHEYWLLCARGGQFRMADGTLCEEAVPETCAGCLSEFRFGRTAREAKIARWTDRLRRVSGVDCFSLLKRLRTGSSTRREAGTYAVNAPTADMLEFLAIRTEAVARLPESVDRVLSPSRFLIDRFVAGGWGREQFTYWPNGVPAVADSVGSRPESSRPSGSLRVGFMGSVTPQKGLHVLARAHRQLKRGTVELHIHGDVKFDPSYWSDVRRDLVASEVHVHGAFAAGEAARVLAPLDVLVVPSIWYENAPLVISEARASGVPVLTSRLGGMMEMVEDGNDGLLFTPGDPDDLARSLEALATDRDRLLDLTRSCRLPRTLEDDAGALRELYQSLMDE